MSRSHHALDSLPTRLALVALDPTSAATPSRLAAAREQVVQLGQQLAAVGQWLEVEEMARDLADLPTWMLEALGLPGASTALLNQHGDGRRAVLPRRTAPSPSLPPLKAEESVGNSRRNKRDPSPSPSVPPKPEEPVLAPRAVPFPDPFNLSLAAFPRASVPKDLIDPYDGSHTFEGGFYRNRPLFKSARQHWTDIGGAPTATVDKTNQMLCGWLTNHMFTEVGGPLAFILEQKDAGNLLNYEQPFHVFGGKKMGPGIQNPLWFYYGTYELVAIYSVTGNDLAALPAEEKESWIRWFAFYGGTAKRYTDGKQREGQTRFELEAARGNDVVHHFGVFRCVGFDVPKVETWVAKREERFNLQEQMEDLEEHAAATGESLDEVLAQENEFWDEHDAAIVADRAAGAKRQRT